MDGIPGEKGLPGSKGQKGDQGIQGADGVMGDMVCNACLHTYIHVAVAGRKRTTLSGLIRLDIRILY